MIEPRRLREQGATAAEKTMLASARNDEPPAAAARQMLASLHGLAGQRAGNDLPHPGTETGVGTIKAATVSWLKIGGLAAGVLGLGAVGVAVQARMQKPAVPVTAMSPELPSPPAPGPAPLPKPAFFPATPSATPAPSPPQEAGQAAKAVGTETSLGAELRLLDLARTAMDAEDLVGAERALDGYQRRFPRGRLRPEAGVLRLAVLIRQGNATAARALGTRLLADDAYRTYQTRIRSLLRDADTKRMAP